MSQVVVISGHPDLKQSYTNALILEQLQNAFNQVDVRRLDQLYPDYQIDVEAEQQALINADTIVLQFPFYWYSTPALLKKWIDDVMAFNFAYGPEGDKLKGKDFILSFTIGGPETSYDPLGYNHFTIEQFLYPLQQTAYLAGMNYQQPIYTHRMVYIPDVYNKLEDVQTRAQDHSKKLIQKIKTLQNSPENRIERLVAHWFKQFDLLPESPDFFTNHLSKNIEWIMPEGAFTRHDGFKEWYGIARKTFKPHCNHDVEQIEVTKNEAGYQVELRIRLTAETFTDSVLHGESINMLVNETWQVHMNENHHITISHYLVEPISN